MSRRPIDKKKSLLQSVTIPPSTPLTEYNMEVPRGTNPMFGLFKKSTKITQQIFIVGYNDGLAGVKEFDSLSAAIFEAEGASMMMPNITVRAENGRLIRVFG